MYAFYCILRVHHLGNIVVNSLKCIQIRLGSADVYSARQTEMNKSTPNIIKVH